MLVYLPGLDVSEDGFALSAGVHVGGVDVRELVSGQSTPSNS